MIKHDKPFDINMAIDDEALTAEEGVGRNCSATVQARPIEGGAGQTVGQYSGSLSPRGMVTVQGKPGALSPGFYYLNAQLTLQPKTKDEQPARFIAEECAVDVW